MVGADSEKEVSAVIAKLKKRKGDFSQTLLLCTCRGMTEIPVDTDRETMAWKL
ncbi:MAG: hypothetical protein R2941_18035 [Desulfobacterales bacterium]